MCCSSAGAKARLGAMALALPKPSIAVEKILVLEVTSGLVGHNYGVITKSTSIFLPSLCYSLLAYWVRR